MYFPQEGDLVPPWEQKLPETKEGRVTPPWSNVNLPRQFESTIGQTAQYCRRQEGRVPDPRHFEECNGKRPREGGAPYYEPLEGQTNLVYTAFLAHRVVTTLTKRDKVERVIEAEREELLASAGGGSGRRDPNAAAPRRFALTVLLGDLATAEHRRSLLDCAAVLARIADARSCVAGVVRVSCLACEDAARYSRAHGAGLLRCETQVALVYVGDEGALHCQTMAVEHKDTNKKLFFALRKTIAALFEDVQRDPPPALSCSLKVSSELITGAHERSMLEANDAFWSKLSTHKPMAPLGYKLEFKEQQTFLKIVPHCYGQNLAHEHVSFGMLLYKRGMQKQAANFVVEALQTERSNCPDAPPDHPLGLCYPQRADELEIGLHVLHVNCDLGASFKGEISAYGVLGVPGGQVCLHEGGMVPRLVFSLRPFCAAAMRGLFVFPCTEEQVNTQNEWTTVAQWDAVEYAVRKYWSHFLDDDACPEQPPKVTMNLAKETKALTEEELHLSRMVGLPLAGGHRVGDVHGAITRLGYDMPVLKSFLLWAMARAGPNASMAEALAKCVEIENVHRLDVEMLKENLTPSSPSPPPQPPQPLSPERRAPEPPHVLFPGRCEPVVAGRLLKAMGLVGGIGFRLELPMTGGRITAVVTVCQRALVVAEDRSAAAWGKENCAEMDQLTAIGEVARNLHQDGRRVFVMHVHDQVVDFDEFLQVDDRVEQHSVPLQDVIKASMDGSSLFLKYDEEAKKLFPLLKGGD